MTSGTPSPHFSKVFAGYSIPTEAINDFPVVLQASEKHGVAFMISKMGFLFIFDIPSGKTLFSHHISSSTFFASSTHKSSGGMLGINRDGQVVSVSINESNMLSHIINNLKDIPLAISLASRFDFPPENDLFLPHFKQFFQSGNFQSAVSVVESNFITYERLVDFLKTERNEFVLLFLKQLLKDSQIQSSELIIKISVQFSGVLGHDNILQLFESSQANEEKSKYLIQINKDFQELELQKKTKEDHEDDEINTNKSLIMKYLEGFSTVTSCEQSLINNKDHLNILNFDHMMSDLKSKVNQVLKRENIHGLTPDEIFAVVAFTHENPFGENINQRLSECLKTLRPESLDGPEDEERKTLEPWKDFLHFLMKGLHKLPGKRGKVFRGIGCHSDSEVQETSAKYQVGSKVQISSFSSAFCSQDKALDFIRSHGGQGVLFEIDLLFGRDVQAYSMFPDEQELIFLPNSFFLVSSNSLSSSSSSSSVGSTNGSVITICLTETN